MLLNNEYTIVPSIRFNLTYSDDTRKVITVKTKDTIDCSYKKNGEIFNITGIVAKIGCNFNSSLGTVGTTAYLQIDGSSEYAGRVEYIQPNQVVNLVVISTTDTIENVVCSVDNETQRISLIRENEAGVAQYSMDGLTWRAFGGSQGPSAYESAVKLGFEGTEKEWLDSLVGPVGPAGGLEIYAVFNSTVEAEENKKCIPAGKIVAIVYNQNIANDTILFVRASSDKVSNYPSKDGTEHEITGYIYLGYLTVGPTGPAGKPGKSAYEYAVEGGYPGSEDEFKASLAMTSVPVTKFFMGTSPRLKNTVIGPIDLRIFGYTDPENFRSKYIKSINISSQYESEDQTLLLPDSVVLRAVPVSNAATKPNISMKGRDYVADCIMQKNGQIGVFRRIAYIDSYSGETIIGDWMSSTGDLDMGAHVQFVTYGKFEPFDIDIQNNYRKLHTFDRETDISIDDSCYVTIVYPIDVDSYIDETISSQVKEYIDENSEEIVTPIVTKEVGTALEGKQDKLTPGTNITIDENGVISSTAKIDTSDLQKKLTPGENIDIDEDGNISVDLSSKQDKLTPGRNVKIDENGVISAEIIGGDAGVFQEQFTTTESVGGIPAGTIISVGSLATGILRRLLAPDVVPLKCTAYWGVSEGVPSSLDGLSRQTINRQIIENGLGVVYTSNNENLIFAYNKSLGELTSIKDQNGFENIDGWSKTELTIDNNELYIYYTNETITIEGFKITFVFA